MTWEFNNKVAKIFSQHARVHIPNYDQVIDQSIEICKKYEYNARIIDVGCAIGETLIRLHESGFTNLVGVDNSKPMLDECPDQVAELILSEEFPIEAGSFNVIISNWTLHFIQDKESYLQKMYDSLDINGSLILTDKTSKDKDVIQFYHNFKRMGGASEEEIQQKAKSIENIMYINDPQWYMTKLKELGFSKVFIINATWCFTTFLAIK